ncbi:MAG TPA: hypothetical protein VEB41_07375 [Burkholderiales bacterium]|nr:hypothetical protein [Burkholderiales bacterium]
MSTLEAVKYLWDAKWAIAPWGLAAMFIAACATPDYVLRPAQQRRRILRAAMVTTACLLLFACLMGLVSGRSFWEGVLGVGRHRGGGSLIFGLIGLCICVIFAFAELAARTRERTSPERPRR